MAKIRLPASKPLRVLVIIGGLLVLCVCSIVGAAVVANPGGNGTRTPTVQVAEAAITPAASSKPTVLPEPPGIGASRVAWEAAHTPSGKDGMFYQYDDDRSDVLFMDDRVWHMERAFGKASVTLDAARIDAKGYLPADAQLVKTYSPTGFSELQVDLYSSELLAQLVPAADWWNGANPGTFIAIYGVYDGRVPRWILAAGDRAVGSESEAPTLGPTTAKQGANLRAGPGTNFKQVGGVKAGDPLDIVGKSAAGDWYKLAGGQWIAAFLVTGAPLDVPVVDAPASAAPAAVVPSAARSGAVALPTARGRPSADASTCDCSRNLYNCDDFPSDGWEAQACYERCKQAVGKDVHDLDRDSDGAACEWEW